MEDDTEPLTRPNIPHWQLWPRPRIRCARRGRRKPCHVTRRQPGLRGGGAAGERGLQIAPSSCIFLHLPASSCISRISHPHLAGNPSRLLSPLALTRGSDLAALLRAPQLCLPRGGPLALRHRYHLRCLRERIRLAVCCHRLVPRHRRAGWGRLVLLPSAGACLRAPTSSLPPMPL